MLVQKALKVCQFDCRIPGGPIRSRSVSPVGDTSCDGIFRDIAVLGAWGCVRSGGCVARQYAYSKRIMLIDLHLIRMDFRTTKYRNIAGAGAHSCHTYLQIFGYMFTSIF